MMSKAKVITGLIESPDGKTVEGAWEYNEKENKVASLDSSLDSSIMMMVKSKYKVS
jgi:hypothetical protein